MWKALHNFSITMENLKLKSSNPPAYGHRLGLEIYEPSLA
jgi:hypothetical protein